MVDYVNEYVLADTLSSYESDALNNFSFPNVGTELFAYERNIGPAEEIYRGSVFWYNHNGYWYVIQYKDSGYDITIDNTSYNIYTCALLGLGNYIVVNYTIDTYLDMHMTTFRFGYAFCYLTNGPTSNYKYFNFIDKTSLPSDFVNPYNGLLEINPIVDINQGNLFMLYDIGNELLGIGTALHSILTFEIGGSNLLVLVLTSGILVYFTWVVVKWFIPL